MSRYFNVEGPCTPSEHYMVKLEKRLIEIRKLVDKGKYFSINRPRQYGKTTLLTALSLSLSRDYIVIELDFQMFSHKDFEHEDSFVTAFAREMLISLSYEKRVPDNMKKELEAFSYPKQDIKEKKLAILFQCFSKYCAIAEKPIILIIDEADNIACTEIFLDFLALLRGYFIHRKKRPTFQSVILAGVYDIKLLGQKIATENEHLLDSLWNIAADFTIDMSFSSKELAEMLQEYENDRNTGMEIAGIAQLLFSYTSGYPFLVSRLCQIMDECFLRNKNFSNKFEAWTEQGFFDALSHLLIEKNPLFEYLIHQINDYPELKKLLHSLLMTRQEISYNPDDKAINLASMLGFIKEQEGKTVLANKIFETRIYNFFLIEDRI